MTEPYLRFVGQSPDERSILRSRPFLATTDTPTQQVFPRNLSELHGTSI
jgi:hypothetical protein